MSFMCKWGNWTENNYFKLSCIILSTTSKKSNFLSRALDSHLQHLVDYTEGKNCQMFNGKVLSYEEFHLNLFIYKI